MKALDGVVENYPLLGFSDPLLAWIECFDRLKHACACASIGPSWPTYRS